MTAQNVSSFSIPLKILGLCQSQQGSIEIDSCSSCPFLLLINCNLSATYFGRPLPVCIYLTLRCNKTLNLSEGPNNSKTSSSHITHSSFLCSAPPRQERQDRTNIETDSMATNVFQFEFEGDDIEEDLAEKAPLSRIPENSRADEKLPQNDPKMHSLEDLVRESFELSSFFLFHLKYFIFYFYF